VATPPAKLVPLATARELTAQARAEGRTVVVANGAFDLLHVGHVRYLAAARELGDLLVVAVNSDRSVRAYKGPTRPVIRRTSGSRSSPTSTASNWLVTFDEATVAEVLRQLRPDVHAKGTDYTPDTVPERDVVAEWGGRTVVWRRPEGPRTSDLIGEIVRRFGSARRRGPDARSLPAVQGVRRRGSPAGCRCTPGSTPAA